MRWQDIDGCSVSIASRWREEAASLGMQEKSQTDPLEMVNRRVQVCKRQDAQVQVDEVREEKGNQEDEEVGSDGEEKTSSELEAFIASVGEMMLTELALNGESQAFMEFESDWAAHDQDDNFSILQQIARPVGNLEEEDELSCTGISWNSTGSQLLVSYGRFDNYGWCAHRGSVCIWNVFSRRFTSKMEEDALGKPIPVKPDIRLEASSGLMCVAGHPSKPAVLAVGSFNGEVMVFDTSRMDAGEDVLWGTSQIEDYCHREPVLQVCWIADYRSKRIGQASRGQDYLLASVSCDGRVLIWDTKNKLAAPLQGFNLSGSRSSKSMGGISMAFCGANENIPSNTFVVGSEGGFVSRCTIPKSAGSASLEEKGDKWEAEAWEILGLVPEKERIILKRSVEKYAEQEDLRKIQPRHVYEASRNENFYFPNVVRFNFAGHMGPVHSLSVSPFHRNAFLSCGADGKLKLFSLLERQPALEISPVKGSHYLYTAAWSPHRPAVFAVTASSGELFLYDLSNDSTSPVACIPGNASLFALAFNKKTRGLVATGDIDGTVRIIKLSWKLSNRQNVDKSALDFALFRGTK